MCEIRDAVADGRNRDQLEPHQFRQRAREATLPPSSCNYEQMAPSPHRKIVEAFHSARMQPYLDAAHQNHKGALVLYRWHADLTAAVQTVLASTEVVLRNAMDRELQIWNSAQPSTGSSWLLTTPAAPLKSLSGAKWITANEQAVTAQKARQPEHRRHGVPITHDDVLAQTSFSLWKELLPNHFPDAADNAENRGRRLLWEEALVRSFPDADDPDGEKTFWRVTHLYGLRNRVSHMEPLLEINVADHAREAFDLLRSVDRDVANWVSGGSKIAEILNRRPDV